MSRVLIVGNSPALGRPSGYHDAVETWRVAVEAFINNHSAANYREMERASIVVQAMGKNNQTFEIACKQADELLENIYAHSALWLTPKKRDNNA